MRRRTLAVGFRADDGTVEKCSSEQLIHKQGASRNSGTASRW